MQKTNILHIWCQIYRDIDSSHNLAIHPFKRAFLRNSLRWREAILLSFNHAPLQCPHCKHSMDFIELYFHKQHFSLQNLYDNVMAKSRGFSSEHPTAYNNRKTVSDSASVHTAASGAWWRTACEDWRYIAECTAPINWASFIAAVLHQTDLLISGMNTLRFWVFNFSFGNQLLDGLADCTGYFCISHSRCKLCCGKIVSDLQCIQNQRLDFMRRFWMSSSEIVRSGPGRLVISMRSDVTVTVIGSPTWYDLW